MFDRSGRIRHHIESEDIRRQPQRRAGVGDIDDAGNVPPAPERSENGVGLGPRIAELGQIFDGIETRLTVGDVDVEIMLLARLIDRDAFEDQIVIVGRRDR